MCIRDRGGEDQKLYRDQHGPVAADRPLCASRRAYERYTETGGCDPAGGIGDLLRNAAYRGSPAGPLYGDDRDYPERSAASDARTEADGQRDLTEPLGRITAFAIWIPPVMGVKNDILPATQNKRYV